MNINLLENISTVSQERTLQKCLMLFASDTGLNGDFQLIFISLCHTTKEAMPPSPPTSIPHMLT